MFKEAGLPDGILNVVNGGKAAVEALCDNEEIRPWHLWDQHTWQRSFTAVEPKQVNVLYV